ncbi:hypothetical protein ACTXT7_015308 [Hymenolepis weldensis]
MPLIPLQLTGVSVHPLLVSAANLLKRPKGGWGSWGGGGPSSGDAERTRTQNGKKAAQPEFVVSTSSTSKDDDESESASIWRLDALYHICEYGRK